MDRLVQLFYKATERKEIMEGTSTELKNKEITCIEEKKHGKLVMPLIQHRK